MVAEVRLAVSLYIAENLSQRNTIDLNAVSAANWFRKRVHEQGEREAGKSHGKEHDLPRADTAEERQRPARTAVGPSGHESSQHGCQANADIDSHTVDTHRHGTSVGSEIIREKRVSRRR